MSSEQLQHNRPQPRPSHILHPSLLSHVVPRYSPYGSFAAANHSFMNSTHTRQPGLDAGPRLPYNTSNITSLTNTALVDALLTPTANEQEQYRRGFLFPSSLQTPPFTLQKRTHPTDNAFGTFPHLSDGEEPAINNQYQDQDFSNRRPRKQQKRKSTAPTEPDEEYVEEVRDESVPPRGRRPRRSGRPRKASSVTEEPEPEDNTSPPPVRARKPRKPATAKKAPKARTGRLIRKKPVGMTVPKSLSEAGPADRMMWEWKNQGKNWEEIRTEWKRITGVEPGGSSLSVRYIKLVENLAQNGAAGDIELLRFKKEAEEELLTQLWPKVAEKMLAFSSESEYNPKDLQKRYNMIVRSGYDVEKLLAEDQMKREAEQQKTPILRQDELDDGFNANFDGIGAYDDPVANATAASLRGSGHQVVQGLRNYSRYPSTLSSMSDDPASVFEPNGLLQHEVDGLNEQTSSADVKYQPTYYPGDETPATTSVLPAGNPYNVQREVSMHTVRPNLPSMSSLVNYDSESE